MSVDRRALLGAITLLAVAGGVLAWSGAQRREAAREAGIERSALREWALHDSDLREDAALAGVSLNRPRVTPLDEDALGGLARSPDYPVFLHRCTSCHATPDPGMHEPGQWRGVVRRMDGWREKAGVMPITDDEREAVVRFMDRAARRGR